MNPNDFLDKSNRITHKEPKQHFTKDGDNTFLSLELLFREPLLFNHFLEFSKKLYCEENLEFIRDTNLYREEFLNYSPSQRVEKAIEIFKKYVITGAPNQLNISSDTFKTVDQAMKEPSINTFKAAEKEIYSIILSDTYPKFTLSKQYKDLIHFYSQIHTSSCPHNLHNVTSPTSNTNISLSRTTEGELHWRDVIFQSIDPITVPQSEKLIKQSKLNSYLYLLVSGKLEISRTVRDKTGRKEVILGCVEEGSTFGEISFVGEGIATASLIAAEESVIKQIHFDDLSNILSSNNILALKFFRSAGFHMAGILTRQLPLLKGSLGDISVSRMSLSCSLPGVKTQSPSALKSCDVLPLDDSAVNYSNSKLVNNLLKHFPEIADQYSILLTRSKCIVRKRHIRVEGKMFITKELLAISYSLFSFPFRECIKYKHISKITRKEKQISIVIDKNKLKLAFKTEAEAEEIQCLINSLINTASPSRNETPPLNNRLGKSRNDSPTQINNNNNNNLSTPLDNNNTLKVPTPNENIAFPRTISPAPKVKNFHFHTSNDNHDNANVANIQRDRTPAKAGHRRSVSSGANGTSGGSNHNNNNTAGNIMSGNAGGKKLKKKKISEILHKRRNSKFIMMDADWEVILSQSLSPVTFSPGDVIIRQNEANYNLLSQIVSGKCRIVKEKQKFAKKDVKVIGHARRGEVIGEIMFLTGMPPAVSVIAEDHVQMIVLNGSYIKSTLSKENPLIASKFYYHLCYLISKRIADMEEHLYS